MNAQHGVALVIVLVFVGLLMMLALASTRDSLLELRQAANGAQRIAALANAEALVTTVIDNPNAFTTDLPVGARLVEGPVAVERLAPAYAPPPPFLATSARRVAVASFRIDVDADRSLSEGVLVVVARP